MNVSKKLLLFFLLSFLFQMPGKTVAHTTTPIDFPDSIVTVEDLYRILASKTPTVIMLMMDNCSHCATLKPHFIAAMQNKAYKKISFYIANGYKLQAAQIIKGLGGPIIPGYPSLVYINKGTIIDYQIGGNKKIFEEKLSKFNKQSESKSK